MLIQVIKKEKRSSVPEKSTGKFEWHFITTAQTLPYTGSKSPEPSTKKLSPLISVKSKSMDAPLPSLPPSSSPPPPPPHASTHHSSQLSTVKESPNGLKKPATLEFPHSPIPPSRSPRSSPTPTRKGYAELQFDDGSINTLKASPVCERRQLSDVPNKFSYSKLNFEKETENELESNVKGTKKPPPAPPRYQGQMMKNLTETNQQNSEHKALKGRSKLNSQPNFKSEELNLDYAEVVFSDNTKASPLIPHCIVEDPIEKPSQDDHPPPRLDRTVQYSTVILTQKPQEEKKKEKAKDKPRPDGYENFDFNPNKQNKQKKDDDGYVNFADFAPGPTTSKRPGSAQGPTVAGSARLLKNDGQPQAKPRYVIKYRCHVSQVHFHIHIFVFLIIISLFSVLCIFIIQCFAHIQSFTAKTSPCQCYK